MLKGQSDAARLNITMDQQIAYEECLLENIAGNLLPLISWQFRIEFLSKRRVGYNYTVELLPPRNFYLAS